MQPFKTLQGVARGSITEKKSEFIAVVTHVETEQQALAFLESIRTEHRTAKHNVYAYQLREGERTRYSDDGEPAKTAGLPILDVLRHAGLTDVMVVVTRYFGGILLGTGGLVRAYTQAAQQALAAAQIVTVTPCVRMSVSLDWPLYDRAVLTVESCGARIEDTVYADRVTLQLLMPDGIQQPLTEKLTELSRGQVRIDVSDVFYTGF